MEQMQELRPKGGREKMLGEVEIEGYLEKYVAKLKAEAKDLEFNQDLLKHVYSVDRFGPY